MAVLFAIIIISGAYNALSKGFSEKTPLLFYGSLIYLVTTIYVIWKPGNPWGHYLLFAMPAVVFLTASLASPQAFAIPFNRLWLWLDRPVRPLQTYAPLLLLTVCFAAGILAALLTNGPWPLRAAQHQHNNYVAKIITVLLRGDQEFMIWGFMPQYYALTGARPTTRDVITQYQVWDNPQKDYFRDRFIADLKKSPPNIIVDAMGEGNFHFKFHPLVPIEQFEELNNYIHENYALLIDLGQCATPITRIFVSHTRLGQLKLPSDFQSISTTICGDKDLTRLLSLLRMGDSVHAPR
jgi:hypothetical protein